MWYASMTFFITEVVASVMRINNTAANTAAAIVDTLDKIRPSGLAVARSFWVAATIGLRPPRTVRSAARPPVVTNDHVHLSESGPKTTSPLMSSHPRATASNQPVARPHHSRSESSVQRLEIPANTMIATKNSAMKPGTATQMYNSICITGCGNNSCAPSQRTTPLTAPDTITATNSNGRNPCAGSNDVSHETICSAIPR